MQTFVHEFVAGDRSLHVLRGQRSQLAELRKASAAAHGSADRYHRRPGTAVPAGARQGYRPPNKRGSGLYVDVRRLLAAAGGLCWDERPHRAAQPETTRREIAVLCRARAGGRLWAPLGSQEAAGGLY